MDNVGLKHVTRDTVDDLCKKIKTSWPRTRREIPSQRGAKRLLAADAPDTQEQKKRFALLATEGAVADATAAFNGAADAPLNAVGLEQSHGESLGANPAADFKQPQKKDKPAPGLSAT